MTTTDKLIAKQKELIEYLDNFFEWEYFIPSSEAKQAYLLMKSEIASLEQELVEQKPDLTAEEKERIINEWRKDSSILVHVPEPDPRDELRKFVDWFNETFDEYIDKDEDIISEYLQQKGE